jgi:hypothetical protein
MPRGFDQGRELTRVLLPPAPIENLPLVINPFRDALSRARHVCRPQVIAQWLMALIPPMLGHNHEAPRIATTRMVEPVHLNADSMAWRGMTVAAS